MLVSIGTLEKINKDLDSGFYGGNIMKVISEQEANKNIQKMKQKVNRINYEKLVNSLLYGVALTTKQMMKASEEIYHFFHDNGAGHLIKDIVFKEKIKNYGKENEQRIEAWLETIDGNRLNNFDMSNLIHRIMW